MRKNQVKIFKLNQEVFIIKDGKIIKDKVEGGNSYPAEKKVFKVFYKLYENDWVNQNDVFETLIEAEERLYELELQKPK